MKLDIIRGRSKSKVKPGIKINHHAKNDQPGGTKKKKKSKKEKRRIRKQFEMKSFQTTE